MVTTWARLFHVANAYHVNLRMWREQDVYASLQEYRQSNDFQATALRDRDGAAFDLG